MNKRGKVTYFGTTIDRELKKRFLKKVRENYYKGKIKEVFEKLIKEYLKEKCDT